MRSCSYFLYRSVQWSMSIHTPDRFHVYSSFQIDFVSIYNEGPQPRSQKCLFLRPQKQACWKFPCALIIICYQHSYHECRHTHTQREGPWMQGMVFCKKEASFFGPVAFNVGATRRDIQGNIHSVWTMIAHAAMEFRRIFLALVWHGSLQCGSVRGYKGRAR